MKYYFKLVFIVFVFAHNACQKSEEMEPEKSLCEISTDQSGQFELSFFKKNPLISNSVQPMKTETICWQDIYPILIGSGGTGNCGVGYESISNPFLTMNIILEDYGMTNPDNPFPRSLDIAALFSCNDFSTQENFYQLLQSSNYAFANNYNDFGKFIIQYYTIDQLYSSINVENSSFQVSVSNIEEIKPQFNSEPSGNNGVPASVDVTLTFSCLLVNSNGDPLLIENAQVNGRFYRQSPAGYYWEDWGKGWNE